MRSIFLWRILVVIIATILLASLLTTGGYVYFSGDVYTDIRINELVPEAEAMGYIFVEHERGMMDDETFTRVLDKLMQAGDMTGVITDEEGAAAYSTLDESTFYDEKYSAQMYRQIDEARINGATTQNKNVKLNGGADAVSVCVPIRLEGGEILGSVYLLKSQVQIRATAQRLNRTLWLALAFVLPFMFLISSLSARKMAEPLRRMAEVAIKMGKGDFAVRADEGEVGEMGLLARALNNLCDTLSDTIHELRADKSQLRHILASLSEGVAATDSVGCLTLYNPALMKMFGAVRVGTRMDLIPDEHIWNVFDEVYRTGETQTMHYPMANDRMVWITFSPIVSDEGERTGVVGLFKDMTEMEKLEKSRRDYVQNISHELRTPLTAMRGLLEPLADGMVTEEEDRQRYYRIMQREVLRLSRLITDMMQLSRLQAGTEYMQVGETDINEILDDVCFNYTKEATQRGINLVLDAPKLPHVVTDPDRVEQILVILLSNAMRYTPEGGTITIKGENFARVNISVIDTGCGIKEEDLSHVFDRFYTADKSRTEGHTGLGLSIAKQLIEKLGEKIIVRSEVGKGACFCFTLKKYVSNAIALGPAHDDWEASADVDIPQEPLEPQEDAVYEILPDEHAEEKARKAQEKKNAEKKRPKKGETH